MMEIDVSVLGLAGHCLATSHQNPLQNQNETVQKRESLPPKMKRGRSLRRLSSKGQKGHEETLKKEPEMKAVVAFLTNKNEVFATTDLSGIISREASKRMVMTATTGDGPGEVLVQPDLLNNSVEVERFIALWCRSEENGGGSSIAFESEVGEAKEVHMVVALVESDNNSQKEFLVAFPIGSCQLQLETLEDDLRQIDIPIKYTSQKDEYKPIQIPNPNFQDRKLDSPIKRSRSRSVRRFFSKRNSFRKEQPTDQSPAGPVGCPQHTTSISDVYTEQTKNHLRQIAMRQCVIRLQISLKQKEDNVEVSWEGTSPIKVGAPDEGVEVTSITKYDPTYGMIQEISLFAVQTATSCGAMADQYVDSDDDSKGDDSVVDVKKSGNRGGDKDIVSSPEESIIHQDIPFGCDMIPTEFQGQNIEPYVSKTKETNGTANTPSHAEVDETQRFIFDSTEDGILKKHGTCDTNASSIYSSSFTVDEDTSYFTSTTTPQVTFKPSPERSTSTKSTSDSTMEDKGDRTPVRERKTWADSVSPGSEKDVTIVTEMSGRDPIFLPSYEDLFLIATSCGEPSPRQTQQPWSEEEDEDEDDDGETLETFDTKEKKSTFPVRGARNPHTPSEVSVQSSRDLAYVSNPKDTLFLAREMDKLGEMVVQDCGGDLFPQEQPALPPPKSPHRFFQDDEDGWWNDSRYTKPARTKEEFSDDISDVSFSHLADKRLGSKARSGVH